MTWNRFVQTLSELLVGEGSTRETGAFVVQRCIQHDQGKGNDVTHFYEDMNSSSFLSGQGD